MPTKYQKTATFHITALDKAIRDHGGMADLDLWMKGYFNGQALPYQKYFYHAPQKDKCLIAGIRTGKSALVSMGFLHFAQYHPGVRLLNTSISSEQAKIVYQNCIQYCNNANFRHWVEYITSSPYPMIRLVNGSELWFRSIGYEAEHIRGFEFDLINIDEAAYVVHENAVRTLYGRLLGFNQLTQHPRIGIMWMVSSPKGQGWLFERWKRGDPQYMVAEPHKYLSLRATIWDNPTLPKDEIERIMADYTDEMIRQEFYGEFIASHDTLFPYHLVMRGCDPGHREVQILTRKIEEWKARRSEKSFRSDIGLTEDITHYECDPEAGHRYVSSWDLGKKAESSGRNATVGMVFDITHEPWSMVAYMYREGMGYVEAKSCIESWHERYSSRGATCRSVIDSTGKGDVLQEFIEREKTIDDLEGIVYSSANKPNLLHAGKIMIERELVRYPFIKRVVNQLSNYTPFDKDIAQDTVMSFCQAMYAAREMTRISERPANLQRTLNAMPTYGARSPVARTNPRYVAGRRQRHSHKRSGGPVTATTQRPYASWFGG